MIPDRWRKLITVLQTICQNLEGARPYHDGMLGLYLDVLERRRRAVSVADFVDQAENLVKVFDLLAAWDRHTERSSTQDYLLFSSTVDGSNRVGKELLETFDQTAQGTTLKGLAMFIKGIQRCRQGLTAIEDAAEQSASALSRAAGAVYESLPLAQAHTHIVSNAVFLHLLFPDHLMPVDGQHTLAYLYGRDTVLPAARYIEVLNFQQEILAGALDWSGYLDAGWNTTPPKLVDNAIILLRRKQMLEERLGW